jgi:hypothetical protein
MEAEKLLIQIIIPILLSIYISFKSTDLSHDYPDFVHELYDEPFYKLVIYLIILGITYKNFTIGLLLMIIVVFIFSDYHILSEGFSSGEFSGPILNNCNIYQRDKINFTGTAFYPLHDNNRLLYVNETGMRPHSDPPDGVPLYDGEPDLKSTMHPPPLAEGRLMRGETADINKWAIKTQNP